MCGAHALAAWGCPQHLQPQPPAPRTGSGAVPFSVFWRSISSTRTDKDEDVFGFGAMGVDDDGEPKNPHGQQQQSEPVISPCSIASGLSTERPATAEGGRLTGSVRFGHADIRPSHTTLHKRGVFWCVKRVCFAVEAPRLLSARCRQVPLR